MSDSNRYDHTERLNDIVRRGYEALTDPDRQEEIRQQESEEKTIRFKRERVGL